MPVGSERIEGGCDGNAGAYAPRLTVFEGLLRG